MEKISKLYQGINMFELIVKIENYMVTQTVEVKDGIRVQMMAIRCHTCTADLAVISLFVILYYNIKSSIFGILFLLN